jgi:uncharacterized membrane protein YsdA (DUF1294 family)
VLLEFLQSLRERSAADWNSTSTAVSNTNVIRLALRVTLPAVMLVALFYTLRSAERERRAWIIQEERAHQEAVIGSDVGSISFVLPFRHSDRMQDLIGFQWPAFAVAGTIAPVPELFYANRKPAAPTNVANAALALTVGLYWFLVGAWMDRRLVQRKRPNHSRPVRIIFVATFALTTLYFAVFLGKDLAGGWPEGPQGAYGVTAWLALTSSMLLTEIDGLRRARGAALIL